jgi:predicted ATPase/class 3 adenylate cyclase
MPTEREQIEITIRGLDAQRGVLGDALVNAALQQLRRRLAALESSDAEAPSGQRLRQVTILFLDVVGSTRLSQRLDPEETQALLDGALERFAAVVGAHGGKILKYAGDSMLAVFGASQAKEDDAERAVRCGLALLETAGRYAAEIDGRHADTAFNVRVGAHTGGVLLGGGLDGDNNIRGSAVNVAARMEQSAPVGRFRISHDTYAHVRGVFDVEPQPLLSVKGIAAPVVSYIVNRLKPRAFRVRTRGIEGIETQMVGREVEAEFLQETFRRVLREQRCVSVTIVGEAGIGKSRLLYEFDQWAETRPEAFYHFEGRITPQTEGQPFGLVRDIIFRRLEIDDGDPTEVAKAKLERGLVPLFAAIDGEELAEAQVHILGHFIGLDYATSRHVSGIVNDARQVRNLGFLAASRLIRRLSDHQRTPVVLEIEDLHWADDGSLDFVLYLAEANADVPLLIVCLTRPMLYERRPRWRDSDEHHRRIELAPLDRAASRALVGELLKKLPEVPAALRELVSGGADGNPFHMEELVRMLVDQGVIDTRGENWRLYAERLMKIQVPPTLTGVVQSRLDQLPLAERTALQQASVIGMVFWDEALAAIDPQATSALRWLVDHELIVPRPQASFEGVREYTFRHQILHRVTYETLLKRTRRVLHAKVAEWLAGLAGARARDLLATAANQYEEAGDVVKACEFYARASEHAASRFAHETVRRYATHALKVLDAVGSDDLGVRGRLLAALFEAVHRLGLEAEETKVLEQLVSNAETREDVVAIAHAFGKRADYLWRRGQAEASAVAARRALAAAEQSGLPSLRLDAMTKLAGALFNHHAEDNKAETLVESALAEARRLGAVREEAALVNMRGIFAAARDDVVESLACSRRHLELQRTLGNRVMEAIALANIGTNLLDLGEYGDAREYLDQSLHLARVVGPREIEGWTLYLLSSCELAGGQDVEALALGRAALDIAMAVNLPNRQLTALLAVGDAELALGRLDDAMRSFEQASGIAAVASVTEHFDAMAGQARVALAGGNATDALRRVAVLLDHVLAGKPLTHAEVPRLILWTCYRVLEANGDARAKAMLDLVHASLLERAKSISDNAYRHSFLNNITEHREIAATWEARGGTLVT